MTIDRKKFNGEGKPQLHLSNSLQHLQEGIARTLEYGNKKYEPYNYLNARRDMLSAYVDAALRHLTAVSVAVAKGDDKLLYDNESGLQHLAHAAACAGIALNALNLPIKEKNHERHVSVV